MGASCETIRIATMQRHTFPTLRVLFAHLRRYAGRAARELYIHVLLAWYLVHDPAVPAHVRAALAAALAYVGLPTDAVPDVVPGAGFGDDLAVLLGALALAAAYVSPEMRARARAAADGLFGEGRAT